MNLENNYKNLINTHLITELEGFKIYFYQNSWWFVDLNTKSWVFEVSKESNLIWINKKWGFNTINNFVMMLDEFNQVITNFISKKLGGKIKDYTKLFGDLSPFTPIPEVGSPLMENIINLGVKC